MTSEQPPVPEVYARWRRVITPGATDALIAENWRWKHPHERDFWTAIDVAPAAETRKIRRQVSELGRLVPLGRHATPQECDAVHQAVHAIVTGGTG